MSSKAAQIRISLLGAAKAVKESETIKKALRGIRDETNDLERAGARLGKVRDGIVSLVAPVAALSIVGTLPAITGAATAGFVALTASIAPVAGVAAPAVAGMLAFQTAAGLARASAMGLDKSFDGMFDDFQQATPATDRLAATVRGLVPDLLSLKNSVQSRVLGGLNDGLQSATPLLAAVRPEILATSDVLGGLARRAGSLMGSPFFTGAAARIMRTNVGVIDDVGTGGLYAAKGLTRVLDAARPLTAWLGRGVRRLGIWVDTATAAGEKSGKLAGFFDKTRITLSRLGRITGDVGGGLLNIFRQGAPLGDSLMVSIVRGAQAFRDWTESARGKNVIGQWFETARPVIDQTAGLIGDLAVAWGRMGMATAPTVAPMLAELRTLIPGLTAVATGIVQTFGPATVDLILAFAGALAPIAGSGGPLLLLFQVLTLLAKGFTWIVTTVPGASAVVSTLVGVFAVLRALTIANAVATGALTVATNMYRTAALVPTIAMNARYVVALTAQAVASRVVAAGTRAMAIAQGALNIAMRLNPIGLVITALVALGVGFVALWKKSETFRAIVTGAWNGIKAAAGAAVSFVTGRISSLVGFFRSMPGRISSAVSGMFGGIRDAFRGAMNWIIDRWNGLELSLGPIKLPGPIPDIPRLAIGTPDIPRFAAGGPVPGGAPYTDRVLGLLMPGEHVIPREEVKRAGGHGAVAAMRAGIAAPGIAMPKARALVAGEDGSGITLVAEIHTHHYVRGREVREEVHRETVQLEGRD